MEDLRTNEHLHDWGFWTPLGDDVYPGMITESGKLVIFGVRRATETFAPGEHVRLEAGDSLLLYGAWKDLEQQTRDPDVILVDSPDAIRRQTIALGKKRCQRS